MLIVSQNMYKKLIMNSSLWFVFQLQSSEQTLKLSHINSTNLSFLEAVLLTVENETDVTAVFKPISSSGHNSTESNCIVDIVANHGLCWIKVTARNASALHRIWQGTQSIHIYTYMYSYSDWTL